VKRHVVDAVGERDLVLQALGPVLGPVEVLVVRLRGRRARRHEELVVHLDRRGEALGALRDVEAVREERVRVGEPDVPVL
jgi:hypothetical protein